MAHPKQAKPSTATMDRAPVRQTEDTPSGDERPFAWSEPLRFFTWPRVARMIVLAALFFWLFHGTLIRLFRVWWEVPDWSHGLLIPLFSFGIFLAIYDHWRDVPLRPSFGGLAVVVLALAVNVLAVWWWRAIMIQDYSWLLLLAGMVVTCCGWRFARAIWFPLFFILFGIRVAGVIYNTTANNLQRIATAASTLLLRLTRMTVEREGLTITLITRAGQDRTLMVAEACSGIRILMAFAALGSLIAYMIRRPWWHRLALVLAIVPIAVVSNVVRVTGMGVLHYLDRPEWAEGFAHMLEGLLMLPIAFGLFWLLHMVLSCLVVEDKPAADETPADRPAEQSPAQTSLLADVGALAGKVGKMALAAARAVRRYLGRVVHQPSLLWRDVKALARPLAPGFREPHFLALAGVLLVAAVSWGAVIRLTGTFFIKLPVPLRQSLDRFPRRIDLPDGSYWEAVSLPPPDRTAEFNELIPQDVERQLSAVHPYRLRGERNPDPDRADAAELLISPQYIQRIYRLTGPDGVPQLQAYFFVSYYTGMPDAVPHVPERCYLGGGFREVASEDRLLQIGQRQVPVRCMLFSKAGQFSNVIYLLDSNGEMSSDHLKVRHRLNNPFGKYAYYAKMEMKFPNVDNLSDAAAAAEKLLSGLLPELKDRFLPDWNQYSQRK